MAEPWPVLDQTWCHKTTIAIEDLYNTIVALGARDTRLNHVGQGLTIPDGIDPPNHPKAANLPLVNWSLDVSFLTVEEFDTFDRMILALRFFYTDLKEPRKTFTGHRNHALHFSVKVSRISERFSREPRRVLRALRLPLARPAPGYIRHLQLHAPRIVLALSLIDPDGILLPAVVFIAKNHKTITTRRRRVFRSSGKFPSRLSTILNDGPLTPAMVQQFLVTDDNFWFGNLPNLADNKAIDAAGWTYRAGETLRTLADIQPSTSVADLLRAEGYQAEHITLRFELITLAHYLRYGSWCFTSEAIISSLRTINGARARYHFDQVHCFFGKVVRMYKTEMFTGIQKGVLALAGKFGIRKLRDMDRADRMLIYMNAFHVAPALMTTIMFGPVAPYIDITGIFSRPADDTVQPQDNRQLFRIYLANFFAAICEGVMREQVFGLEFRQIPANIASTMGMFSSYEMKAISPEWDRLSVEDMPVVEPGTSITGFNFDKPLNNDLQECTPVACNDSALDLFN